MKYFIASITDYYFYIWDVNVKMIRDEVLFGLFETSEGRNLVGN